LQLKALLSKKIQSAFVFLKPLRAVVSRLSDDVMFETEDRINALMCFSNVLTEGKK